MMVTQQIRPSQFITTYGPGSILEGARGPRIIPGADIGLFLSYGLHPENYEISDQRMSSGLLSGARIFRLPSNAELGELGDAPIYKTKSFPNWKLCLNMGEHGGAFYILHNSFSCPPCSNIRSGRNEPIRFVIACSDGHLDDIDWDFFAHFEYKRHTQWYIWHGGGGSLSNIEVECPTCGKKQKMSFAYGRDWKCSGRFPEREPLHSTSNYGIEREDCSVPAKIVQRQASNLRIPKLRTLFSISPRDTKLHQLLQKDIILGAISPPSTSSFEQLKTKLKHFLNTGKIDEQTYDLIIRKDWEEIKQAIRDVLSPIPKTYDELLVEEYQILINASINGAPQRTRAPPRSEVIFEVNPNFVKVHDTQMGKFRVTPILKLQTITAQLSYRREVNQQLNTDSIARDVDISFTMRNNPRDKWLPGTEFLREGIFISLENSNTKEFLPSGSSASKWNEAYSVASSAYSLNEHIFRGSAFVELNPLFIWWHSLSHLILRSISEESGYSSAAIRERVYLENGSSGTRGGILLYATQPGTEGTLGGLIALVPNFDSIMNTAIEQIHGCSGGPLCLENSFSTGRYNGAACPGCLLLSETSCEHRNMWLDRNVLMDR